MKTLLKIITLTVHFLLTIYKYSDNKPVEVLFKEQNQRLEIHIMDQGIGVLKDDIAQITQNFYRGKNTQHYQGKGIGLSIANIIFKLHKIELIISQNQPQGTIVRLVTNKF